MIFKQHLMQQLISTIQTHATVPSIFLIAVLKHLSRNLLLMMLLCMPFNAANAIELITYYHTDVVGSPIAATDESGNLLWHEEYKPYGERLIYDTAASSNPLGFTGKAHDDDTGLTYMGARYYDPIVGRFMGIDPVGFQESNIQSVNRYAYANNNPYKYVDPDGELPIIAIGFFAFDFYTNYQDSGSISAATTATLVGAVNPFKKIQTVAKGAKGVSQKLSKVKREAREDIIGNGKFTKKTKVIPGKGPGQSRAEMEFVKNSEGKLIRSRKFSFDRGNKFKHNKPARGGPEGRLADEN